MNQFLSDKILPPSLKIPKFVKFTFRAVHFFSKRLTLILASKLFTTPVDFSTPKRELGMLDASQKKSVKIDAIDKEVHVLSYGYSNKKVLLAHGWAGRSTQLFMIANKLLENGFMVISFDGPAHGKSSGKTTNLTEYIETIKALCTEFGPFEAAIGHSFGGMGILNTQAQENVFKKIVTVGSGDKISTILNNFAVNLSLPKKFGHPLKVFLEKKWMIKTDDFASSNAAKRIDVPVLVVHDSHDGDVHVSSAVHIRQNLKNGTLLITENLGHTKILRNKKVTNKIVNFIIN